MKMLSILTIFPPLVLSVSVEAIDRQKTLISPPSNFQWTNLGTEIDILQISSLSVSPDPLQRGSNYTITVSGTLSDELRAGATVDLRVHLGLTKLLTRRFDLCDNEFLRLDCPVARGGISWTTEPAELSATTPAAKFRLDVLAFNADDEELFNVEAVVDFLKLGP